MLLAIDTGGTKTLVSAFDTKGQPGPEHRFITPRDKQEYIAQLLEIIHEHYDPNDIDAIVIAIPGVIRKNIAVWCGNLPWKNFDIAAALKVAVSCPIWVQNDANLAGLAETRALPTQPAQSLYVTVSTGIGTGIIVDGAICEALSASEGGHIMVEYDGKVRLWESFAAGSAIKETYGKYARDIHDPKVWKQIADKISRGFLVLIPALQPDVIIIGGSIGTYFEMYGSTLRRILTEHLPDHIPVPEIRQAVHPEEAVIYGCYYYGTAQLNS